MSINMSAHEIIRSDTEDLCYNCYSFFQDCERFKTTCKRGDRTCPFCVCFGSVYLMRHGKSVKPDRRLFRHNLNELKDTKSGCKTGLCADKNFRCLKNGNTGCCYTASNGKKKNGETIKAKRFHDSCKDVTNAPRCESMKIRLEEYLKYEDRMTKMKEKGQAVPIVSWECFCIHKYAPKEYREKMADYKIRSIQALTSKETFMPLPEPPPLENNIVSPTCSNNVSGANEDNYITLSGDQTRADQSNTALAMDVTQDTTASDQYLKQNYFADPSSNLKTHSDGVPYSGPPGRTQGIAVAATATARTDANGAAPIAAHSAIHEHGPPPELRQPELPRPRSPPQATHGPNQAADPTTNVVCQTIQVHEGRYDRGSKDNSTMPSEASNIEPFCQSLETGGEEVAIPMELGTDTEKNKESKTERETKLHNEKNVNNRKTHDLHDIIKAALRSCHGKDHHEKVLNGLTKGEISSLLKNEELSLSLIDNYLEIVQEHSMNLYIFPIQVVKWITQTCQDMIEKMRLGERRRAFKKVCHSICYKHDRKN